MLPRFLLSFLLLAIAPLAMLGQTGSVGIGTTTPDASAALDIVSSGKGLLLPRVAATDIASPVPGLLVYQTGAPAGFYYNAGTAAPGWQQLATTGSSGNNLGNHTATQNINLNGQKLVGTTARAGRGGLAISGNGLATLGAARSGPDSTTTYGVRLLDLDQEFVLTSKALRGNRTTTSVSGIGDRVMWISYYSAFRAGGISGTGTINGQVRRSQWDYPDVGRYSVAFGLDNQAGSDFSTAFGSNHWIVAGDYTFVTGYNNKGYLGRYEFITGYENAFRGYLGFMGGYQSKTQTNTFDSMVPSFAFGYSAQARSNRGNCYALSYYTRTGGQSGSFALADMSPLYNRDEEIPAERQQDSLRSTAFNQSSARFAGGYRLFTTRATAANQGNPVGVQFTPGGNAWRFISDSTKKERAVLADGNQFLARINRLRLGFWNYIGQSANSMRHYGPMAQGFFAAFGHDAVGRIGHKTSINQIDFDGVNLIAIQALYRRVLLLEAENARQQQLIRQLQVTSAPAAPAPVRPPVAEPEELRRQNAALQARAAAAETTVARATATLDAFEARLRRLEAATGTPLAATQAGK
ncbi:hypothetical protein [Hymenobacter pini]|uniref:hypothetical protein n=1 Tax=Hymenobacter pini TaxID=2880879 RepID=UPI001CF357F9|nr:hypothetical protein [Hymenobacter pini]MCA8829704.1 hypothetical protein [Hymenobacter pini]